MNYLGIKERDLMNDYLKQIKDNEPKQIWPQEDGDFYLLFMPESWDIVLANAECMMKEIERLRKFEDETKYHNDVIANLNQDLIKAEKDKEYNAELCNEKDKEIARLKAELEKIVRCGECKNWKQTYVDPELGECPFRASGNSFSMMFCWNGQRKSEEGK